MEYAMTWHDYKSGLMQMYPVAYYMYPVAYYHAV